MQVNNFDWGIGESDPSVVIKEIFEDRIYEKFRNVKQGDIVVDIGANVGAFTYSILDKNPEKIYCIEPSEPCFDLLFKNTKHNCESITYINRGFTSVETDEYNITQSLDFIYGHNKQSFKSTTFSNFITKHKIEKIDFMKIDCEGGEYHVFTEENKPFIDKNVKYISGEWHLSDVPEFVVGFKKFRDLYLKDNKSHFIYSREGVDVTTWVHDDNYIDWYSATHKGGAQFIIYILNP